VAETGLDPQRLDFFHVAASQAHAWVEAVEEMTRRARELGPNPLRVVETRRRAGRRPRVEPRPAEPSRARDSGRAPRAAADKEAGRGQRRPGGRDKRLHT
jgi:hypothetical protein